MCFLAIRSLVSFELNLNQMKQLVWIETTLIKAFFYCENVTKRNNSNNSLLLFSKNSQNKIKFTMKLIEACLLANMLCKRERPMECCSCFIWSHILRNVYFEVWLTWFIFQELHRTKQMQVGFLHFASSIVDVSPKTSNFKKSSWKTNNVGFI